MKIKTQNNTQKKLKIKILTVATDKNKAKYLLESGNKWGWKIDLINPEFEGKWKNSYKIKAYYRELQKSEEEMMVLLDGYDVIVQCTPKDCVKYIKKCGNDKLIIGDDCKSKTPDFLSKYFNFPIESQTESSNYLLGRGMGYNNFKHNSGVIMGNRKILLKMYSIFCNYIDKYSSDQQIIGNVIKDYPYLKKNIYLSSDYYIWHMGINPPIYMTYVKKGKITLPNKVKPLFIHRTNNIFYKKEWSTLIIFMRKYNYKYPYFLKLKEIIAMYLVEILSITNFKKF